MVPRQKLHGRQMGRLVFSQVTVEEAEAQEGEMTQVTRQEESDRPGPGDLRMGLPSHPSQGRDWRHTEGGLPWLPAHQQSTKLPASKAELPWHYASSFQLPSPAQLSHAFVSQLAKTPDGDRPASTPGVCLCGTPGAPRALFIPKQQRKEVTASSQHANPCKPHSL